MLGFRNPSWDLLNARMLGCSVIHSFTYNFYWDLLLGLTTYHVLNRSTCIWNLHRWTNSIECKCIKPLITISVTECLSNLLWHSQEIATPRLNERWPLSKRAYCVLTAQTRLTTYLSKGQSDFSYSFVSFVVKNCISYDTNLTNLSHRPLCCMMERTVFGQATGKGHRDCGSLIIWLKDCWRS